MIYYVSFVVILIISHQMTKKPQGDLRRMIKPEGTDP